MHLCICKASSDETDSECKTLAYIGIILTILSLIIVTFLHYRKSRFCEGHEFSTAVKIIMFISDMQKYLPIKLCKTAGSIYLFKIRGTLKPKNIKLNKNYLWKHIGDRFERSHSDFQLQQNNFACDSCN